MRSETRIKVKLPSDVTLREEIGFGGIAYVHHRNDFFALDKFSYKLLNSLERSAFRDCSKNSNELLALARVGLVEVESQELDSSYSGPGIIGDLEEIPTVSRPLVVNVFSSHKCSLNCKYCYAKDLMIYRQHSEENSLEKIRSNLDKLNPMVVVLTGGDPLSNIDFTVKLIDSMSNQYPIVLDTSGIGSFGKIANLLFDNKVHVRISLDSLSIENDTWRYSKPKSGLSSRDAALNAINICNKKNIKFTVQSVIHKRNDNKQQLEDMRDGLIELGVSNWVLHLAVKNTYPWNKATRQRDNFLPSPIARDSIVSIINSTRNEKLPIDIRCTDSGVSPNSVLLIDIYGNLYTEGYANNKKLQLTISDNSLLSGPEKIPFLDWSGHAKRYLNWNKWQFSKGLETFNYSDDQ